MDGPRDDHTKQSKSFVVRWMDLESVIQSEVKSEREKQIPYIRILTHIYGI